MLEGLLAALAMFFAPPADPVRAPEPLVVLNTGGGYVPSQDREFCMPVFVTPNPDGSFVVGGVDDGSGELGEVTVTARGLPGLLKSQTSGSMVCDRIFIRADADAPYGDVLSLVSMLHYNGFKSIAFIDVN